MARSLAALFLTLVLALASVTAAVARGQAPGGMAIIICTGSGPETIVLGPDGEPAAPRLVCPDCTAAVDLSQAPATVGVPASPAPRALRIAVSTSPALPAALTGLPGARAPPLPV